MFDYIPFPLLINVAAVYTGLHGVIYQKTGIVISTAVRTADHASNLPFKNRVPYFSVDKGEGVSELLGRLLKQEEKCIHILSFSFRS